MYSLKQSYHLWYEQLAKFLYTQLGLHQIHTDHNIFITNEGVYGPIITIFIDDLNIFVSRRSGFISQIKNKLAALFDIVEMGPLAFYVRLKVTQNREKRTIKLSQPGYIKKLLDRHSMLKAKITKVSMRETPLLPSSTLTSDLKKAKYSAKVGSIMYAMVETQIDIAFAPSMVS